MHLILEYPIYPGSDILYTCPGTGYPILKYGVKIDIFVTIC
jgi:hypothetical protein